MVSAAEQLVRSLIEGGLTTYFGVPGVDTLPIYTAVEAVGARSIIVRHEATAAYAADAHFRVTGRPAVCLTTGGPGAANTAAAMGEAWASSSTLLHITTDVPSEFQSKEPARGLPHFHPDQLGQFAEVTKASATCLRPGDMGAILQRLQDGLLEPPHAPVVLEVPLDVLGMELTDAAEAVMGSTRASDKVERDDLAVARLEEAARLLRSSSAPLIWVGTGGIGAAHDVTRLAEALDAPIVLTHSAKRAYPAFDHQLVLPFPPHEPAVAEVLKSSDVMVVIGSDLDAMMTRQFRTPMPPRIIQIDVEPAHVGLAYPVTVSVIERSEDAVPRLLEHLADLPTRRPAGRASAARAQVWSDLEMEAFAEARKLLEQFDAALPLDAIVVSDMSITGYWAAGYLSLAPRRQLLYPMGWGTLGFGLPASIGAATAAPGRRTVCIIGDAGLLYAAGELATIAENQLPVTVVVNDDGGYGMLRFAGRARFGREVGMDLRSPDFVALAGSFGIAAQTTEIGDRGLPAALRKSVEGPGPSLLVVRGSLEPPRMSRLWE
jgi:acetolactate synthase-1/2/3 large subunit